MLQLLNCNDPDITEEQYTEVIIRKTATLFEAGTRLAAIISQSDKKIEEALADYGMQLGIAFQIIDDALDYSGQDIGKNIGDDLEEGKPTLPLIRAMESGNPKSRNLIRSAIEEGGRDKIERVMAAITQCDAIEYTTNRAKEHALKAKQALESLPASEYRDALSDLADFAVARAF